MGSNYCGTVLCAPENGLEAQYRQLVQDCQYESGHGGYTGTFAEKHSVQVIPPLQDKPVWDRQEAHQHCQDNNQKWDASYAYWLGQDRWYVGGWCSD